MEVRLDELDRCVACYEGDTTYLQHGNPGWYLEQGCHVPCCGRGPDPLPGVFHLASRAFFEEPAHEDRKLVSEPQPSHEQHSLPNLDLQPRRDLFIRHSLLPQHEPRSRLVSPAFDLL